MMSMYGMSMPTTQDLGPGPALHSMGAINLAQGLAIEPEEPSFKKQRTEDNLLSEEEFLARNSGPIAFKVQVPNVSDKPEWKLNGQTLSLTMAPTDLISVIKTQINDQLGIPPGKQKLQYEGMFIKDSSSLAFYNVGNGSTIVMGLKERGGRKK
jgi:splicing factor 3A subunit 1